MGNKPSQSGSVGEIKAVDYSLWSGIGLGKVPACFEQVIATASSTPVSSRMGPAAINYLRQHAPLVINWTDSFINAIINVRMVDDIIDHELASASVPMQMHLADLMPEIMRALADTDDPDPVRVNTLLTKSLQIALIYCGREKLFTIASSCIALLIEFDMLCNSPLATVISFDAAIGELALNVVKYGGRQARHNLLYTTADSTLQTIAAYANPTTGESIRDSVLKGAADGWDEDTLRDATKIFAPAADLPLHREYNKRTRKFTTMIASAFERRQSFNRRLNPAGDRNQMK